MVKFHSKIETTDKLTVHFAEKKSHTIAIKMKQVAQRATIAHLTASHQNILNSSQVKDFLNWSRAANSAVHGWPRSNFKLIRDYIVVLVTCKNEENPIKIEGARVLTSLLFDFSDAQGQLTPKAVVEIRQNSNSSKLL